MHAATLIAVLALAGTIVTAVAGFLQHRQTLATTAANAAKAAKVEERSVGRAELETALANQRERLAVIHGEYRQEIRAILHRHAVELGALQERATSAEARADQAQEHAARCDLELTEVRAELTEVRAELAALRGDTG